MKASKSKSLPLPFRIMRVPVVGLQVRWAPGTTRERLIQIYIYIYIYSYKITYYHNDSDWPRFGQSYGTKPGWARLVTIRYSHYCERARWVLDRTPLEYTEDSHPPGLQMFPVHELTDGE